MSGTLAAIGEGEVGSRRIRRAQLVAEAVAVCCPSCGESQPNHEGSEMWIPSDFGKKSGRHECVSCEEEMLISGDPKAILPGPPAGEGR